MCADLTCAGAAAGGGGGGGAGGGGGGGGTGIASGTWKKHTHILKHIQWAAICRDY